jgi:hypothetical protein
MDLKERNKKRLTAQSGHDKVYIEGYNSFMIGEPMSYNIYDGKKYDIWLRGWEKAYEELRDKYNDSENDFKV